MEIKVKRMSIKQSGVPEDKTLAEHMEIMKGKQGMGRIATSFLGQCGSFSFY